MRAERDDLADDSSTAGTKKWKPVSAASGIGSKPARAAKNAVSRPPAVMRPKMRHHWKKTGRHQRRKPHTRVSQSSSEASTLSPASNFLQLKTLWPIIMHLSGQSPARLSDVLFLLTGKTNRNSPIRPLFDCFHFSVWTEVNQGWFYASNHIDGGMTGPKASFFLLREQSHLYWNCSLTPPHSQNSCWIPISIVHKY